ncbi:MAG: alkaline phosphatase PhoX, partial [Gemmatimonadales bacterium]
MGKTQRRAGRSMSNIDRRNFLKYSAKLTGGAVAGLSALQSSIFLGCSWEGRSIREVQSAGLGEGGYGPLRPAGPDLALPEGFQYEVFGIERSIMSDGNPTPSWHDGMCAFPLPNGNIRLIRNHEVRARAAPNSAIGNLSLSYDSAAAAGTTSLEIDPATREVVRDFVSLGGSLTNCAGGLTPWGSWLTCEEVTRGTSDGYQQPHGYVFDVPVGAESQVEAIPLPAMGRFYHEAVAVDPATG